MKPIAALRSKVGLPPSSKNALVEGFSPFGTWALFPPVFAPAQPDWPTKLTQIGFPLFDEETTSEISMELQQFLEAGPAPVVFTLGTAVVMMETSYFETAYRAISALGLRAVFLVGKKPRRIPAAALTDSKIHVSGYEPFSKLFSRAAVIVHQCGIGTTAQALVSGRPQILVPFAHDQPDNARRVVALGCGLSIPARRLNEARLISALEKFFASETFAGHARDVADKLQGDRFDEQLLQAVSEF